uniref:Uncharacterized protein n=1 Tax=Anguilla anguilla TaxID=7936 RepID=A0A0E9W0G8_ANGAN
MQQTHKSTVVSGTGDLIGAAQHRMWHQSNAER